MQIETSDVIAGLALVASIISLIYSHITHKHSVSVHELETRLVFVRDRSELLVYTEESRKLFEATQVELDQAIAALKKEPFPIRHSLKQQEQDLLKFQKNQTGAQRQSGLLWEEIYAWDEKSGRGAFAHHGARFRALLDSDRLHRESALRLLAELPSMIESARKTYNQQRYL